MRVGIVGGALQGVELCWLGRKAAWDITLLDRRPFPPALYLATRFLHTDITSLTPVAEAALRNVDLIIPATENANALQALTHWARHNAIPLAFDPDAYAITACKKRSRALFLRCDTPIPPPAHGRLSFPLLTKPAAGSGSKGVQVFHSEAELLARFPKGTHTPQRIFESYCPGPSFSVEVCGTPEKYQTFAITELFVDATFDCKRVTAPVQLSDAVDAALRTEAVKLAESLKLHGIMDVEIILSGKKGEEGMHVLEIDARFPSQTPAVVYLSSGVNLAERLAACYVPRTSLSPQLPAPRSCVYEHVRADGRQLRIEGEHIMHEYGPLMPRTDFFGANEALVATMDGFAATLIFTDDDSDSVQRKRVACHARLLQEYGLDAVTDASPLTLPPTAR